MIHPVVCNPVLSPLVGIMNPPRWRAGRNAPLDSILHWDADIDAFSEQTGGVHRFNHSVLSPQYQRNADGSYANVGAKPAVDTVDGKKWLRSCGAVTNLLTNSVFAGAVSGTPGTAPTGWSLGQNGGSCVAGGENISLSAVSARQYIQQTVTLISNTVYTFSSYIVFDGLNNIQNCFWIPAIPSGSVVYSIDGITCSLSDIPSAGKRLVSAHVSVGATGGAIYPRIGVGCAGATTGSVTISNPQLTATAYPQPYVPTTTSGPVTQPASNATTTNGCWFALPDGSPLWQALDGQPDGVELWSTANASLGTGWAKISDKEYEHTGASTWVEFKSATTILVSGSRYLIEWEIYDYSSGGVRALTTAQDISAVDRTANGVFREYLTCTTTSEARFQARGSGFVGKVRIRAIQRIQPQPLTLATRVRMGVGSGDLPNSTNLPVIDCSASFSSFYLRKDGLGATNMRTSDGVSTPVSANFTLTRGDVVRFFAQVNTAGTQFRVGYMIEGTHTTIQWSAWTNYDSSFNPSTLYRLMLGYSNAYPMWFNKITAWKKQATDAEILEAMAA